MQEMSRAWKQRNRARVNTYRRTYNQRRFQLDPSYRFEKLLRGRLEKALHALAAGTKKAGRFRELIGCSLTELRVYLSAQFTAGMSWENYGKWEVDHITPCAAFHLGDPDQQRVCFNFRNLQPLWKDANRRKGAKLAA